MLRAFVRLVEVGSFTAVGRELRVKQSTVSKWIAALEDEVGSPLVDRTTRAVRITDGGVRFYEGARRVLESYDAALASAGRDARGVRGRVRISLPVVFGSRFVVPALAELLEAHPGLSLDLRFDDAYVNLVDDGIDLAVRIGASLDSSATRTVLGESARRLVASPTYLARAGTPLRPTDLAEHQCLLHTDVEARTLWSFARDGQAERVSVGGRVASNHSETTRALALAGHGVCLLADWLVDTDLARGALVQLLPEYDAPAAPIHALTPPGRRPATRVKAIVDHLRDHLREHLRRAG